MVNTLFENKVITEIAKVITSPVDKKSIEGEKVVFLCNYMDVYHNSVINENMNFMSATATETEINKFILKVGDVVITKDSETADDIGVPAYVDSVIDNLLCGYHLSILRPLNGTNGKYLFYALMLPRVSYSFYRFANGITRFGLTKETYEKVKLPIPPLPEQKAIASLLSVWDEAIEKTERLIEVKEANKIFYMKKLLSGEMRLNSFNEKWKTFYLGELFINRKEVRYNDLPLLSISREKGVIPRNDIDKIDTSNDDKSKYLRICPGDIGYNTMRMWQGVSALSDYEGIISPAYTVCTPKSSVDGKFISYLFKIPKVIHRFYRYSQGLTSDTWNLKYHHFAKIKVSIPKKEEQIKIAGLLQSFDKELDVLKQKLELLKTQKRGLMQKLLTGKWQVKVNEEN